MHILKKCYRKHLFITEKYSDLLHHCEIKSQNDKIVKNTTLIKVFFYINNMFTTNKSTKYDVLT